MSQSRITQPRVQQNTSIMDRLKIIGMRWRMRTAFLSKLLRPQAERVDSR